MGLSDRDVLEVVNAAAPGIWAEARGTNTGPLTNAECVRVTSLIEQLLVELGTPSAARPGGGERQWWTCQFQDGGIGGRWAHSAAEAAAHIAVFSERGGIAWIVPDDDMGVCHRYYPKGKRSHREAQMRFPVTDGPISDDPLEVPLEGALF